MELENLPEIDNRLERMKTDLNKLWESEGTKYPWINDIVRCMNYQQEQVDLLWHAYKAQCECHDNIAKTLERREKELAQIKKENIDIRKEVNGKNRELENKVSELYGELEEQERKFNKKESELQDEIHHLDEKLKKLSDENELVKELEKVEERCAEYQMETKQAKEDVEKLKVIVDESSVQLKDAFESIGVVETSKRNLEAQLRASQNRVRHYEEVNEQLRVEKDYNDEALEKLEELNEQNEKLQEQVKNKMTNSVLQKSYDELTTKHNRLMMSHDNLHQELDKVKGELAKAWNQVQDRDVAIRTFMKPNNRISTYQYLRTQNKKLIDANLVLQEQVRELEQQSGLLSKIEHMKAKDKQIRADRFRLMQDYDEQLETVRELLAKEKDKNKELKKSNKKLLDNLLVLTGKVTNYESITEFETKIAEQKERIRELRVEKHNYSKAKEEEVEILRKALKREKENHDMLQEIIKSTEELYKFISESEANISGKMISIRQRAKSSLIYANNIKSKMNKE